MKASGLLRRNQRLGNERLDAPAAASAPIADAAEPDVEIIIAGHDAGAREVRVVAKSQ